MSINIKTATGLQEIGKVTKEKIITALDYTPANEADLPNIQEDNSGELYVTDESGNVIVQVDSEGLHTTEVEANGIMLGQAVSEHIDNSSIHVTAEEKETWNNKSGFSGVYDDLLDKPNIEDDESGNLQVTDESGNIIMEVDSEGLHTTEVELSGMKVRETLVDNIEKIDGHTDDSIRHITSAERAKWDAKSDFSGVYDDLVGQPNITENKSGNLQIADNKGNVVMEVNDSGLKTTTVDAKNVIVNGEDIKSSLDEHKADKVSHITDDERNTWNNKSDFSGVYEDLIDKPNISEDGSNNLKIADESGNIIVQVDEDGLETTQVKAKTVLIEEINVQTKLAEIDNDIRDINDALDSHEKDTTSHITSDEREKWNSINELDESVSEHIKDTASHITADERTTWNTVTDVASELDEHKDDNVSHITSDERTTWNAKSDFSGNYIDLIGKPNITPEENDKSLTIADESGNVVARFDDNGLETTKVTAKNVVANGVDVTSKLDEHTTDIDELQTRLNALADSDDTTLDQLSEIVAYIKSNKSLIDAITTSKVSVSDIIDNLTTAVANKPLSANQGVVIKSLIDGLRGELESHVSVFNSHVSEFNSHVSDTDVHITTDERTKWNKNVDDLDAHEEDTTSHITEDERNSWNAKSEFSGNYVDLVDAPNITTDEEDKSLTVVDETGNVIMKVDEDGLETTKVTTKSLVVNSNDIEAVINEHKDNIVSHITEDERKSWNAKSDKTYVDEELSKKSDNGHVHEEYLEAEDIVNKTDKSYVDEELAKKSDVGHVHEQYLEADDISGKADISYVDTELAKKSDEGHTHEQYLESDDISSKADISYVDYELEKKSDKTHTHEEYLTSDDISNKADKSELHEHSNKTELDKITDGKVSSWDGKADKSYVDEQLTAKADSEHEHSEYLEAEDIANLTTIEYVNAELTKKANVNHTHTIDSTLSNSSTNPVQNKVVSDAIVNLSNTKVDKVEGSRLITSTEAEKLDALVLGDNNQVEISGKVNAANVEGLDELLDAKADVNDLTNHISDTTIHITEEERITWDNKSDFSGIYDELENAPNITEDESGEVVITDESGNIIFKSDVNGLETTKVTAKNVVVNGTDVEVAINEHKNDNTAHLTSDERTTWADILNTYILNVDYSILAFDTKEIVISENENDDITLEENESLPLTMSDEILVDANNAYITIEKGE